MPLLEIGGARIHLLVSDAPRSGGPAVLLLHGLGSCAEDWLLQRPALEGRYRLLMPDLRGHGRSSVPTGVPSVSMLAKDVRGLLRRLGEEACHVVGLSLGGAVALSLALDAPEYARSLVLVNTFARIPWSWRSLRQGAERLGLLARGRLHELGERVAEGLFPDADQAALRELATERVAANSRAAYAWMLFAVARFDARRQIGRIAAPTLVIAGERDTTVPMRCKEELARRIPGARLAVIPGSGHATPIDAAGSFNRLLLEFLAGV